MNGAVDLSRQRFGELTVIKRSGSDKNGRAMWLCKCSCGAKKIAYGTDLRAGRVTSCGKHSRAKDPYSRGRLYWVWHSMKTRCLNESLPAFKDYGGRGIHVCSEWRDSFTAFRIWAYENGYDENAPRGSCTLDRIDNDGDYCPENCRWVSMEIQAMNKRMRDPEYWNEFVNNKILIHVYGDMSHCFFVKTKPEDY